MTCVGAIRESPAPDHPGLPRSALPLHEGDSRIASTTRYPSRHHDISITKEYETIPVHERHTHADSTLYCAALAPYETGFTVYFQMRCVSGLPGSSLRLFLAEDDLGNVYVRDRADGHIFGNSANTSINFVPAIAPNAREIRFVISDIDVHDIDKMTDPPTVRKRDPLPAPWVFTVPLLPVSMHP